MHDKVQQQAFESSKDLLTSSTVLTHFNPELPIMVACDASKYGIGAHKFPDGSEGLLVMYPGRYQQQKSSPLSCIQDVTSSRSQVHSQIEKEALACIFGVKKFHSYLHLQFIY